MVWVEIGVYFVDFYVLVVDVGGIGLVGLYLFQVLVLLVFGGVLIGWIVGLIGFDIGGCGWLGDLGVQQQGG